MMPSIEISKLQAVTAPRALADTDRAAAQSAKTSLSGAGGATAPGAASGVSLEVNASVDTSSAPVDTDRVQQIKSALQDGSYPLIPTEIADAMIAAQVSFGIEQ